MRRNSTVAPITYWGQFEEIGQYNPSLNVPERLWAAWYAWMQNDVLATGIMSFVMHEMVYFGRSLPWIFIDSMGLFNRYKIQNVSCRNEAIILDEYKLTHMDRTKFLRCGNNGIAPSLCS
jgi:methylsterol monooxygenase